MFGAIARASSVVPLLPGLIACSAISANAATVTAEAVSHFVDRVGTSSFSSLPERTRLTFGLFNVNLDSTEGTSGTYAQGGVTGNLRDVSSNLFKEFVDVVPFDPDLTGSWTLTMTNHGDVTVFETPTVSLATPPEFVTNVTQSGDGTTPTFEFALPEGVSEVQIEILDLTETRVSAQLPQVVFDDELGEGITTFTVPDDLLRPDGIYSIVFKADVEREDGSLEGRSRVFYDFTTGDLALPDVEGAEDIPIFLPQTDTTSGTPIFNFNNPVVEGELAFFDPIETVIGYDFAVGATDDVLFSSVVLPDIGDGMFELLVKDENGLYSKIGDLVEGVEFTFEEAVGMFRILGIEPGLINDPADNTAFVTGLRFNTSGQFTGTMAPIIAPIPLPAGAWLLLSGLAGFLVWRRRGSSA